MNSTIMGKQNPAVVRVKNFLDNNGYSGEIFFTDDTIFTVEDASRAVGVSPEKILKSLVLLVDGNPVLALLSGINRVDTKKIRRHLDARKVKLARPEYVLEYSGYKIGGVPPVGYPEVIPVLVDLDVSLQKEVWAAAGTEHCFFPVSPEELVRFTGGIFEDIKK